MTSSDISKVEKALADARAELELIQSPYLTITEPTSQWITLEIKPFTESQAVKDHLTDSITRTLGKERAHIFLESNKEYLNDQFSGFGNRTTKLEIVLGEDPSKDWMREETTWPGAKGGFHRHGRTLRTLPQKYRNLIKVENPAER